ncbi:MAG: CBS domain-containing protein [Caldilineae bacterium]|nr:MAG: CBS domain-containing protein [Caldilineae bacterium]
MLVKDIMTRHPIMVAPETPAAEAQRIMAENHIRHLPVAGSGKRLLGLITRQRLALKPENLASLNVWEISRLLGSLTAERVMLKAEHVYTITPDKTVERAAHMMTDHKIGCLPVLEDNVVVGIITEADLLQAFQVMLGLPAQGVRVTVRVPNRTGEFNKLMTRVAEKGWGVLGIGSFPARKQPDFYDIVLKIPRVGITEVREALATIPDQEIVDIREVV